MAKRHSPLKKKMIRRKGADDSLSRTMVTRSHVEDKIDVVSAPIECESFQYELLEGMADGLTVVRLKI